MNTLSRVLSLSVVLCNILMLSCIQGKSLPSNWPISRDVIPKNAIIRTVFSDDSSFVIAYRLKMSTSEYVELLDNVLKKDDFRVLAEDHTETINHILDKEYISKDGLYSIVIISDNDYYYAMSVITHNDPDVSAWESAKIIE
jgi:hypothetical protein